MLVHKTDAREHLLSLLLLLADGGDDEGGDATAERLNGQRRMFAGQARFPAEDRWRHVADTAGEVKPLDGDYQPLQHTLQLLLLLYLLLLLLLLLLRSLESLDRTAYSNKNLGCRNRHNCFSKFDKAVSCKASI